MTRSRSLALVLVLATVVVACLGAFLSGRAPLSEASAVLALALPDDVEHAPDGQQHPGDDQGIPTAVAEEAEPRGRLPAATERLTALLIGLLSGATQWRRNPAASVPWLARCWFYSILCFLQRRPVATLSGVFRL